MTVADSVEIAGRLVVAATCLFGVTLGSAAPQAADERLDLWPLASTRAMCSPGSLHDQMAQQRKAIRSSLVRDGHLFLSLMADGGLDAFEPLEAAASVSTQAPSALALEGPRWIATRLGATAVTATGPRAPHLVFTAGRVAGSDGCNRVSGGYTREGQAITFGAMVGTQMACPGTGEVERAFGAALRATRSWRISGSSLELRDADGEVTARFEAQDPP